MQFKVGDAVVHPVYRVGHIIEIEEKQFSEEQAPCLYYHSFFDAFPKTSIWIPVEAVEASVLRPVTAKNELKKYRKLLQKRPLSPGDELPQRHTWRTRPLKQSSFQMMCEIVRDLTLLSWQKQLSPTDASALKNTRESLLQEWAVAANISLDEATEEVKSLLREV